MKVSQIVHQIVGAKPSQTVSHCLHSWLKIKDHGFEIYYWDDDRLEIFLEKYYGFALQAFLTARNHAERADIARYLLVYHYGGYYVDWDISLNNIDEFLMIARRENRGYLVIDPINGSLASEHFSSCEKDPYLIKIVEDIVSTFERDERDLMSTPQYSGPFRMRATLRKFDRIEQSKIPVKEIFEYSYDEVRRQREFCKSGVLTHFWEHSWIE